LIVLEASAVLELLFVTDKGRAVAERIAPLEETLHAPHLVDLEVAQVLRRYVSGGQIDPQRAREALEAPPLTSDARLRDVPDTQAVLETP
jgi:predicted nucleic acid-binding protein